MIDGALPEMYRMARNIKVGYEIRLGDGTWAEVATQMHVTSPSNFVTFTLTTGVRVTQHPRDEVMSRKVGAVGAVNDLQSAVLPHIQCGAKASHCVCTLPPHDETTPHHCQAPRCGGQWTGTYGDDSFNVLRFSGWSP